MKLRSSVGKITDIYFKNRISVSAAALTYYLIFSFFPLCLVINGTIALTDIDSVILSDTFKVLVPYKINTLIEFFLEHISVSSTSMIIIGITLTVYSMTRYIRCASSEIKKVYHNSKTAKTITEWMVSIALSQFFMLSLYVLLFIILLSENFFEFLSGYIFITEWFLKFWIVLRYGLVTVFIFFILLTLFYILPGVKQKFSDVIYGTLFTVISWTVISFVFSLYINNISDYSLIYGSLGAVIILLLWFSLTNNLILIGGIINSLAYNKRIQRIHNIP